ncbi:MAG: stage II sporulation protein M [Thermoactinomyces vulgaris]
MKRRPGPFEHTLRSHFQSQKSLYIFVTTLFMMGVIFGAVLVNSLDPSQKEGLLHYLGYFFQGLKDETIAEPEVAFQHSLGDHLKTIGLMWILGLSVIGIPVLLVLLFLKGLVIGFTVGFLFSKLSWQGLWFAFVSIVPQNLLIIPVDDYHHHGRHPVFHHPDQESFDSSSWSHLSAFCLLFAVGDGHGGGHVGFFRL